MDRKADFSSSLRGGGVLLALNSQLSSKIVNTGVVSLEHIVIRFSFQSTLFILCLFYIPPNSNLKTFSDVCKIIKNVSVSYPSAIVCILGDFNVSYLTWCWNDDDTQHCVSN